MKIYFDKDYLFAITKILRALREDEDISVLDFLVIPCSILLDIFILPFALLAGIKFKRRQK